MNVDLDPILHQPVRTKIVAYLIAMHEVDFTTLKKTLDLSDGHMSTHMKILIESQYVEMKKEFVNSKPRTSYKITAKGKGAFRLYLEDLKKLILT